MTRNSVSVSEESKPKYHPILTWKKTVNKIPWGVIVLLGGGFAMASATSVRNSSFGTLQVI